MGKISVFFIHFLLITTLCQAKHDHGCCRKIDAINKNALSLEVQCQEIQVLAETLVAGGCCGGTGECACAPTPIVGEGTIQLLTPGTYCLTADLLTSEIEASDGVMIDLNGHTIRNIFGGIDADFTVKNGTLLTQLAVSGEGTASVYGVKVPELTGGNMVLVEVSGLQTIGSMDSLVMIRCSSGRLDAQPVNIAAQEALIYDSVFKHPLEFNGALTELHIYQSVFKNGLAVEFIPPVFNFSLYKSYARNLVFFGPNESNRILIEESCIQETLLLNGTVPAAFNGLVTRSCIGSIVCNSCWGFTCNESMVGGEVQLNLCENVECTNVSSQSSNRCFGVNVSSPGQSTGSLVFRDCFATTQSTNLATAGYSFEGTCTAINVLNCYAKGCPNGFLIASPTDSFLGVIKECVVDGCTTGTSYAMTNPQNNLYPYGNVAISVDGVPVVNYSTNAFTAFNPLVTALTAIETDTVTSWRNLSFELP